MQKPSNFFSFVLNHDQEIMVLFAKADTRTGVGQDEEAEDILYCNFSTYEDWFVSFLTKENRKSFGRQKDLAEKGYHQSLKPHHQTCDEMEEKARKAREDFGKESEKFRTARQNHDDAFKAYQEAGDVGDRQLQAKLLAIWIDFFRANHI